MITLVLAARETQALGRLVMGGGAGSSVLEAAASSYIALTPAGEAVAREFWRFGDHHPEIKPLAIQLMPDHVHFIVHVTKRMAKPLGNAIGGFKAGSSKAAIGAPGLWAEGFQDTVLSHEGQLSAMFAYLKDNPRRLAIKRHCPSLFRVRRDFVIPLALPREGGTWRFRAKHRTALLGEGDLGGGAGSSVLEAADSSFPAHFEAIGNNFLLDVPWRVQVQCSRRDFAYKRVPKPGGGMKIARDPAGVPIIEKSTPAFEDKRDDLLAAARHGAVLVSPCISDGEREIAHRAFAAGYRVIKLSNMGFSPLYKPGGRLFAHTADGRLLMLAPAAWPYAPAEKPMTRLDACVLNRIAQLISGDGAAEIDYKGVKPCDIDKLVARALQRDVFRFFD